MYKRPFAFGILAMMLSLVVSVSVHGQETVTEAEAGQYLVIPIPKTSLGADEFKAAAFVWSGDPGVFTRAMVDQRVEMFARRVFRRICG